jgi:hypothetical protein
MNQAQAKAVRRDIRRAFGGGVLETLDRREQTLEQLLAAFGAVQTVLIDTDKRLSEIEARSWSARWTRFTTWLRGAS